MAWMRIKFVGLARIFSSLNRILQTAELESGRLPKICAIDYVDLVRNKIIHQDFSYTPLSEGYAKWKQKYFPQAKTFWHLGGDLLKAIQAINLGTNTWAGTIPASVIDSGGKNWNRSGGAKSILYYALALEQGVPSMNIAARPLFGPANEEYAKNGYLVRIEKVRKKFIRDWR